MTPVPELVEKTRQFVRDHVIPVEREVVAGGRVTDDALRLDLQKKAKEAGVFGPLSDPAYGGLGLDTRAQAEVLEAAGASLLGPLAVNAWAPDDGNIHLLAAVANPEQRQRYLAPLASGEVRSAIAMTEPAPGAGSDPRMLATVAEETDTGWVINGDTGLAQRYYRRYVADGPYLAWAGNFGTAGYVCPAPDFAAAEKRRKFEQMRWVKQTLRRAAPFAALALGVGAVGLVVVVLLLRRRRTKAAR